MRGLLVFILLTLVSACHSTARSVGADLRLPQLPHHSNAHQARASVCGTEITRRSSQDIDSETGEPAPPAYGTKEDILDLKNTDRITCEIQGLLHGLLTVKTDSMGTLSVEWVDVVGLQSRFKFRIETRDRKTWFGSLSRSTESGKLIVDQDGFQVILDMLDIVLIEKVETTFLDRIKGYINFGFNYSEATRITQGNLGAGLNYKSRWNVLSADFSAIVTDDSTGTETSRGDFTLDFKRFFTGGLYGYSNAGFQRNTEMGIALRTFLGLGVGVSPIRSSIMDLSLSGGLNGNRESALGSGADLTSLEGVLSASYQIFIFKSPKTDLATNLIYFPSITEGNRYRIAYDFRIRQEIASDFFIDFKYYLSYDSSPPSAAASTRDYGIITSLGYSW